jgi:hypothetical protein
MSLYTYVSPFQGNVDLHTAKRPILHKKSTIAKKQMVQKFILMNPTAIKMTAKDNIRS